MADQRRSISLVPHVHELLKERRDAINSLRAAAWEFDLSLPNMVELFCRFAKLDPEDIQNYKPTTRKAGRQKRRDYS